MITVHVTQGWPATLVAVGVERAVQGLLHDDERRGYYGPPSFLAVINAIQAAPGVRYVSEG